MALLSSEAKTERRACEVTAAQLPRPWDPPLTPLGLGTPPILICAEASALKANLAGWASPLHREEPRAPALTASAVITGKSKRWIRWVRLHAPREGRREDNSA